MFLTMIRRIYQLLLFFGRASESLGISVFHLPVADDEEYDTVCGRYGRRHPEPEEIAPGGPVYQV